MAKQATINVKIDSKQGQKGMKDLEKTISGTENKAFSLKNELKQMKDELATMDRGTKEFHEMELAAADLQDRIGDINNRVKILSSDTLRLDQTIGVIQGMAGAYGAVQGSIALLGVKNEELMQVMVKLQAIQTITNGLNQVAIALNKDSAAGMLLREVRTKALTLIMGTQTSATVAATTATRTLNIAMRALPIVAVVGALAGIVSSFSSFNKAQEEGRISAEKFNEEQKKLAEQSQENSNKVAEQSGSFVGLVIQLKNTNAQSVERSRLIKQINDQYGLTLQNLSDEKLFHEQLNVAINDYLDLQRTKVALSQNQEKINELIAKEIELNKQVQRDYNTINELAERNNITFGQASRNLSLTNKEYRANLKAVEAVRAELFELGATTLELNEKQNDLTEGGTKYEEQTTKSTKATKDLNKAMLDLVKANQAYFDAIEADRISRITDAQEKELQAEATKYDRLIELAEKAGQDTTEITERYNQLVFNINEKYRLLNETKNQNKLNQETILNDQILILNAQLNLQKELNEATTEEKKKQIRAKYTSQLLSLQQTQLKNERDILLQNTELTEKERNKIIADYALKNEKLIGDSLKLNDEDKEKLNAEWFQTMQGIQAVISQAFGEINNLITQINANQMVALQNENNYRQQMYDDTKLGYETQLENQTISREEFDAKMKVADQKKKNEDLIAARKAFQMDKRMRIAQGVMSMAQGILQGFTAPFPLNMVLPAIAGVAGAIQLASIKQTQFRAATGGIVPGQPSKTDSVNALLAPGEAVINSNSTKQFAPLLSAINQMGGGKSLVPDTELKSTPDKRSFNKEEKDIKAYVVFDELKQKQVEDDRYRRNGRV
jgi:hypothetical protein